MKLPTWILFLPCLGQLVYAVDTEWFAVLHRNPAPHSVSRRHELMLEDMGAVHQDTFDLGSLRSYSFSGPKDAAERIAQHPDVAYVHPNYNVSADSMVKQTTVLWNLQEISQPKGHGKILSDYLYDDSAGNGTVVYILDTGIDIANVEFGGRAEWGITHLGGKDLPHDQADIYGHGTIVAGVVGSNCCGVAKNTKLVAVKVLDNNGDGKIGDIAWAVKWAFDDAKKRGALGRAVINLSLGARRTLATVKEDFSMDVITEVVKMGMFVVTAAGNDNCNALEATPGAAPAACNVGAYDAQGERAQFSNYGPGVDLWAPGVKIWAAGSKQKPLYRNKPASGRMGPHDGTSFSAPHVAGVAAYLMGLEKSKFDPAHPDAIDWCDRMRKMGRAAVHPKGIEPLLYNGAGGRAHTD